MNWIQNDHQNVDGVDQHQSLTVIITSSLVDILFHNVTQFWCCFMSDDRVRLHVKASVVSVSSSLVFFGNSVQKMCTSAPYHITMKTRILGAQV